MSGRVYRKAAPFGAQIHLWQLPVYQAAPIAATSSGSMPGRVRRIHQGFHAPRPKFPDQRLDREHESGLAGHVIEQREPRALGDTIHHGLNRLVAAGDGKRQVRHHDPGSGTPGHEVQHVAAGVVLVIGGEEFVARLEVPATGALR